MFAATLQSALGGEAHPLPPIALATDTVPPARVRVPAVGIDAPVQHVGTTAAGTIGTPSNFTDAGWFSLGPAPGEPGIAIIDGHVDNGLSLPGVFKSLHELRLGDTVYIESQDGAVQTFVVDTIEHHSYQEVPEHLFSRTGAPRIALITCTGKWLAAARTYDTRVVVFGTLVAHHQNQV